MRHTIALLALLLLAACTLAAEPTPVWLEGEAPTRSTGKPGTHGWGEKQNLSGGAWLSVTADGDKLAAALPKDGATFAYDFTPEASGYDVWLRIGFEFARSPFQWRIDGAKWGEVGPNDLTTDLMAIADFAEVAWRKVGRAELTAGKHTLEIRLPHPVAEKGQQPRVLFGLDAICLAPKAFIPNGPHKPGADWKTAADKQAETASFAFPGPASDPAARSVLDLTGTWQVARFDEIGDVQDRTGPLAALPGNLNDLPWKAVRVPGDKDAERPDLTYCHRLLYRARVSVPKEHAGRAFVLRFPNTALLTTVFVNGTRVGFGDTPCAAFDCDATAAIKPGTTNDIVVEIRDVYYALAKVDDKKSCRYLFNYPPQRFYDAGGLGPTRYADYPVLFQVRRSGILEAPTLTACGAVYAADVFCIPKVSAKKLVLMVTLVNSTAAKVEMGVVANVRPWKEPNAKPVLTTEETKLTLAAHATVLVELEQPWPDAKLWWPDDPFQYVAETTVSVGGKAADALGTKFGFREWGIGGNQFTLNGIPWHLRADQRHNGPESGRTPNVAVAEWRKNGQNTFRYWGERPWTGTTQQATLDYFDASGMAVRRTGTFDGEVASYALVLPDGKANRPLFDNWRKQLAAWVKAERNHPSVFVWSIENEITYINTRNFGWLKPVEPEIKAAVQAVQATDPTRPVMIDGGDALTDRSLPVYGNHYLEADKRDYPDEAYTLGRAYGRETEKNPRDPWPVRADKPLFLGESYFANGSPPAAFAEVDGDAAFLGRKEAARGVARFARWLSEGYRWHGVAAFHFWFAEGPDAEHYAAWQPVCVLCREWDSAFASGSKVPRTLKAFNDTRFNSPITAHWLLTSNDGTFQQRGSNELAVAPGAAKEFGIELTMPDVGNADHLDLKLVLSCNRDGKEVFRDVRAVRVIRAVPAAKVTDAKATEVALYDPAGKAKGLLDPLTAFTAVKDWKALPDGCRLLVVGPDAVTAADSTDPAWSALALRGVRVVVLDQSHPLHYVATPADAEPTSFTGRIAFPENAAHPAFNGLARDDFFYRTHGGVVYRNAYRKPTRGGRSLLQCDRELSCTALMEVPVGGGLMLLSQFALGDRPDDPVGRRLLANLVKYAWEYKPAARPTAVLLPPDSPRAKLLAAAGLKFKTADDVLDALAKFEVVVADGTPANLAALAKDRDAVAAFTAKGGQLVLWGVTPAALADFNAVVGFEHVMRPFRRERVRLPVTRDPLLAGVTLRDVTLESAEKIYPWAGDRYPADDTFTHVVDLDDPAPFVASDTLAHGWSQMTNGLTSADSWKFIFYHDQDQAGEKPTWAGKLAKPETLTGISIVLNADYRVITKLRVVFDGDRENAETLTLKPEKELKQEFTFAKPHACKTVALEPLEWTPNGKAVIGVDNLWLRAARPADFAEKVVSLLNIGGLVRYPMDKGGVVLVQLKVPDTEANPENADKRRAVASTLLRNLGCEFAADRVLLPGVNLAAHPLPFGDKCNAYLTNDKGWLEGQPDLGHFPRGEQKFGGVRFDVRDFTTSPLPAAVVLAGNGAKGITAKEVSGIPVDRTADALFFLHTFHPSGANPGDGDPPVVFEYVVTYADGKTATVPVRLGREVGPWNVQGEPKPPSDAAVAWTAPFPNGPKDRSAAVYQMRWVNPRPGEKIATLGVRYDEKTGNRLGVPVVLAATAATAKE